MADTFECPACQGTLKLNTDGDWECDPCGSKWCDLGDEPDFDEDD